MAKPESGDGVVVMANGAGGFDLIPEILAGQADSYGWPEADVDSRADAMAAG